MITVSNLPPPKDTDTGSRSENDFARGWNACREEMRNAANAPAQSAVGGFDLNARALEIADAAMFDLLVCHGFPDEDLQEGGESGVVDLANGCRAVNTLEEADPAIQDAFEWLGHRGLARLCVGGRHSIYVDLGGVE
jgi:hypothetical protein